MSRHPDLVTLVAVRFADALERTVPLRPVQPELVSAGSLAAHFKNAAIALRTATDLVLTHQEPDGRWRTRTRPFSPIRWPG